MTIPSTSNCGSLSIRLRLTNEPGSPSSALQIRYFGCRLALYRNSHFNPVENAAPPRPHSPDFLTSSMTFTGFICSARGGYEGLVRALQMKPVNDVFGVGHAAI